MSVSLDKTPTSIRKGKRAARVNAQIRNGERHLCDCPNDAESLKGFCGGDCKHIRPWGVGPSLYEVSRAL